MTTYHAAAIAPPLLLAALPVLALAHGEPAPGEEPLVTDRPDFTESAVAVPVGRLQFETGLTFTRDGAGSGEHARSFEAPEALLRFGVWEGFELRLGAPGYAWADDGAADEDGLTDSSLGFKLELGAQEGARPALAVLAGLSIPTGSDPFASDRVDPTVVLAWSYDLSDSGWSVAGNVGVSSLEDASVGRYEEFTSSLAVGIPINDALGAYAEYFGFYRSGAALGPEHSFNTGVTYLINSNTQLDARIGVGLNGRADDLFAGAGVSFRF